jgi:hypothetical protein
LIVNSTIALFLNSWLFQISSLFHFNCVLQFNFNSKCNYCVDLEVKVDEPNKGKISSLPVYFLQIIVVSTGKCFSNRYTFTNMGTLFRFCSTYQYTFKKCSGNILKNSGIFQYQYSCEKCSGIIIYLSLQIPVHFLKKYFGKINIPEEKTYRNSVSGGVQLN